MSSPRQIFNIVVSILPGSLPDKTVLSVDVEIPLLFAKAYWVSWRSFISSRIRKATALLNCIIKKVPP